VGKAPYMVAAEVQGERWKSPKCEITPHHPHRLVKGDLPLLPTDTR